MSRIKVAFLSHHFKTPRIFLDSILKMTPGKSGVWKNIEATTNVSEADYYFITDDYNGPLPDAKHKAIYTGQHPKTPYSPAYTEFAHKEALLKLPLNHFLNPGEWWIDFDYDYLSALKPNKNRKNLICVMTYQTHNPMYHQRVFFVEEFVRRFPNKPFDLYGRPSDRFLANCTLKGFYRGALGVDKPNTTNGEHLIGKNLLAEYDYSLEFDVGPCQGFYLSERVWDSFLMWCTPIHFGCTNIEKVLPYKNKAYYTFDQNNLSEVLRINEITTHPKDYKEIGEIRNIILNKYQMWAYAHFIVNNIDHMLTNPRDTYEKWIESY